MNIARSNRLFLACIWMAALGSPAVTQAAPLPLDPKLSAVAPEKCMAYLTLSGFGGVDPDSQNQTEQLLAEPQVQRLIAEIQKQILVAMAKAPAADPKQQAVMRVLPKVLNVIACSPIAAYLEDVRPQGNSGEVDAALIIAAGERRPDLEAAISELLKLHPADAPKLVSEPVGGVDWQRIQLPPEAPPIRFGWSGDYFIVAVGKETHAKVVERMAGDAPAWLTKVRDEHPIEQEVSVGYVNVETILERARPFIEADDPQAWPTIEKLGFTHVQSLHGVSGYDEKGTASFSHLETDGERVGVLALLPHLSLSAKDLSRAPKDALLAVALRLDPGETWDAALELASSFDPNARAQFQQHLDAVKAQFGIDVESDVVRALGDVWTAYLPGGDLMTSWFNSAAAIKVKDPDKLRSAMGTLIALARTQIAQSGQKGAILESTVDGVTTYTVQTGEPMPVSPSWSITEDWIVAGLTPQAVRGFLDRKEEDSLAVNEAAKEAISSSPGPASLSYQDTQQFVKSVYPFVQMGVGVAAGQLRQQGFSIDMTALPAVETIVKHLRPSTSTVTFADDGITWESRGSLPAASLASGSTGFAVGLLLPAVQAAREAARRNQSMNNMKQIELALLNYESANGHFPAYATFDDNGKPLLSWRVLILPYMEHQELYSKFHLDEPWDSENNKPLIALMPEVYRDPSSGLTVTDGKSSYLGALGKECVFDGTEEGRKLAKMTDGTSNTISVLQVKDEAADVWSKPADWEFDRKNVKHGLGGPHGGDGGSGFLAGFCDGHIEFMGISVSDEKLEAQITVNGGEIVPAQ